MKHTGIRCLKCNDEIFSMHRHDFKYCKCNACAVDGGFSYIKISANDRCGNFIDKQDGKSYKDLYFEDVCTCGGLISKEQVLELLNAQIDENQTATRRLKMVEELYANNCPLHGEKK